MSRARKPGHLQMKISRCSACLRTRSAWRLKTHGYLKIHAGRSLKSEAFSRQTIREAWKKSPAEQNLLGFRYTLTGAAPLTKLLEISETDKGKTKTGQLETSQIVVPIELRGERIGSLIVQSPSTAEMDQDRIDLIKAVADRVAISAENARLFDETTRRAERERTVSDITGKIRSVNDPQAMIQIAIEELRNALGATRVEVIPQTIQGSQ